MAEDKVVLGDGGGDSSGDSDISDDDSDFSSSSPTDSDEGDDNDQSGGQGQGGQDKEDDEEEEDPVIKAITKAQEKKESNHPPDLVLEDGIIPSKLCFHPVEDMIVVGGYGGEVVLYGYSNTENRKLAEGHIHGHHGDEDEEDEEEASSTSSVAVRALSFSQDGGGLIVAFSDQTLEWYRVKIEGDGGGAGLELVKRVGGAMPAPPSSLHVIDKQLFAVGDDDGNLLIWSTKGKEDSPRSSLRLGEDAISSMTTGGGASDDDTTTTVVCTSEEGAIYSVRLNTSGKTLKLIVESEVYKFEFNASCLFKQGRKLAVGDGHGDVYLFNWGEFGKHSDVVTRVGRGEAINAMIPITERIILFGGDDGVIRAYHFFPVKYLGVVGRVGRGGGVEGMDVCNDGHLVASLDGGSSVVNFWNVRYFEDFKVGCSGKGIVVTTTKKSEEGDGEGKGDEKGNNNVVTTTSKKSKKGKSRGGARQDLEKNNLPSSSNQNVEDFFSGLVD